MQAKGGKSTGVSVCPEGRVQQENQVQALVITDCYNNSFSPLASPKCLLPLVNRPLLEYTLRSLSQAGVHEVILFCSAYANKIKDFVKKGKWGRMSVNVVVSEGCRSLGDAMRDIDAKSLIRGDFVLITGDLVGNVQLRKALETHKKHMAVDKSTAMTLILKECGKKLKSQTDEIFLVCDNRTGRLLTYFKNPDTKQKIKIPLEMVLEESGVELRCDVMETGIAICSVAVPALFSDNFDFQTEEDFMRGLLTNDEIIESSAVYCSTIDDWQYAATVSNWHNYHSVSHDIIHRWTYPQVPDDASYSDPYSYRRNNLYIQQGITIENGSNIVEDVVIAGGSFVGENATLSMSVVGRNSQIMENASVTNSHIFDNVIIERGATIEYCVLGDGCRVREGARLRHCILGQNVVVESNRSLAGLRLVHNTPLQAERKESEGALDEDQFDDDEEEEDEEEEEEDEGGGSVNDGGVWVRLTGANSSREDDEEEAAHRESDSESDDSDHDQLSQDTDFIHDDDTNLFYREVVDSLVRGYEDKISCDNLILEVNSSRYAYNVSLTEVNYHLVRAILSLDEGGVRTFRWHSVDLLDYFLPLIRNYIRNPAAMKDCLAAIEDEAETNTNVNRLAAKILHTLYDTDVLEEETILAWYESPAPDSSFAPQFRKQVAHFIKWLKEADVQSSDDE